MHAKRSDVHGFMTEVYTKLDGEGRDPRIGQEAHRLRAKRVELVVGQGGGVGECLSDVFFLEVRQVGDDLRRRHAVRDEIDDMRDRDAKTADCRTAGQHIRILRNSVKPSRHVHTIAPIAR